VSTRYLLRRVAQVVPAVAGIVLLAFIVIHTAPGDPVLALAGEHGDAAYYAFMRQKFGLDRSLPEQLRVYASRLLHGDLGLSYVHGRPVVDVVSERLPATLLLTTTALTLSSGNECWPSCVAQAPPAIQTPLDYPDVFDALVAVSVTVVCSVDAPQS
jgi:peptide/nickel transport system permease protein